MKKTTVTIIILSNVILVLLIIIFGIIIFNVRSSNLLKKQTQEFLYNYDLVESEYLKQIKNRDEWRKDFKAETEREKMLLDIIDEDTKLLNECQDQKDKLKKELEIILSQISSKKNNIELYVLAGGSGEDIVDIEPDVYVGIKYNRTLVQTKKVDFYLGGGVAVKIYQNKGMAGTFQLGVRF